MPKTKCIKVFEYSKLIINNQYGKDQVYFKQKHFDALIKLNEFHNCKYFDIGYKSIYFKNYVGIVQIDDLAIEILPKADKNSENENLWQEVLIQMLKTTKKLRVNKVGNANVNQQSIHLLDIYFEWFLNELKMLIYQGLIRQYYIKEGNLKVLKGKLMFARQVSKNIIHKERFYTEHQIYERDHLVHQVLGKALKIIAHYSKGSHLYDKCKTIQLDFPEVSEINISSKTFDKITINRKNKPYETALQIAKLIILNYAPNITAGKVDMLALLFDMNSLWEEYILNMLKKAVINTGYVILGQTTKTFWGSIKIRPDIVIIKGEEVVCIIDTKWKNIDNMKPSIDDLRQMFVYNEYWYTNTAVLLYPGNKDEVSFSNFNQRDEVCGIMKINLLDLEGKLDKCIGKNIIQKIEEAIKREM